MRKKQPLDFITDNPIAGIMLIVAGFRVMKELNKKDKKMETKVNYQKLLVFAVSVFFGIIAFGFCGITIIETLMQQSFEQSERKTFYTILMCLDLVITIVVTFLGLAGTMFDEEVK